MRHIKRNYLFLKKEYLRERDKHNEKKNYKDTIAVAHDNDVYIIYDDYSINLACNIQLELLILEPRIMLLVCMISSHLIMLVTLAP